MPLAPGLLSMIICPPSALPALSASARITASVEPPAGQGQIRRIGFAGKACACARPGRATLAAAASEVWITRRRVGVGRGMNGFQKRWAPWQADSQTLEPAPCNTSGTYPCAKRVHPATGLSPRAPAPHAANGRCQRQIAPTVVTAVSVVNFRRSPVASKYQRRDARRRAGKKYWQTISAQNMACSARDAPRSSPESGLCGCWLR